MPASVVDAFDVMFQLSPDAPWVAQVRKKVAAALNGPAERREDALFSTYLEAEHALVLASNGELHPDDLRRRFQPTFAAALGDYPDFALNFESPERQFVFLTGEMIRAWSREIHGALGVKDFEVLLGRALAETNWRTLKVTVAGGVEWNVAKLRTLAECIQMASTLFEGTYRGLIPVLGLKPSRRSFERAFTFVATRHPRLSVVKNLLGATPLETLSDEKSLRLHDLETETASQEHGLRVADEGLHRQAERLQQTVGELENTRERLEATSRAKDVFIDVVSHQFRTPLSTVRWNAELLYDELTHKPDVDPAQREAAESIRSKSVYLIETLDRVFATLEINGALVLNRKPAFLWEIIQNIHDGFEREIKAKNLDFKFVRSKSQVKEIPLDKTRIEAVLKIVMGNAIAYASDNGRIVVDLSPSTVNGLEYLVCSVSDDGLGLPADDLPKFFEKFFRSKSAVLKVADGTGLGNYIVKNVIEAHKGWVAALSAGEGKGTTVRLALPLA